MSSTSTDRWRWPVLGVDSFAAATRWA